MQGKRIKPHIFLEKLREDVLKGPSQVFQGLDKEQQAVRDIWVHRHLKESQSLGKQSRRESAVWHSREEVMWPGQVR